MLTIVLLTLSNIFMTFAWYGHFKYKSSPLTIQEVITLVVFSVFSVAYLREDFRWNYIVAFGFILLRMLGVY